MTNNQPRDHAIVDIVILSYSICVVIYRREAEHSQTSYERNPVAFPQRIVLLELAAFFKNEMSFIFLKVQEKWEYLNK